MDKYEFPVAPASGEQWLAVHLSWLKTMSVADCLSGLQKLGYTPELRYQQNTEGDISLVAVLRHWVGVEENQISSAELQQLWNFLGDDDIAITCKSCGLRNPEAEEWWAMSPEARAQACRDAGFHEQAEEELAIPAKG